MLKYLAFAAAAAAQCEDTAYCCETDADCDANYDAIYEEWSNYEVQPEGSEPVQGELMCAMATLNTPDESVDQYVCLTNMECDGGEWVDD